MLPLPADLEPYLRAGYDLIPLTAPTAQGKSPGKAPRDPGWRRSPGLDRGAAQAHMARGGNVGVRLRAADLVLDVDPRNFEAGKDPLALLAAAVGLDVAACPRVQTGSGGWHLYLRKPEDTRLVDSLPDYAGVEFKSFGRQVVSAGSVHQSGRRYEWEDWPPLERAPQAPAALLSLASRPAPIAEGGGTLSPEAVAGCLAQLPADSFRDHEKWLALMMACHHASGGEARQEFVDWSASDPKYAGRGWETGRRWDSLTPGKGVTVRTLFKAVNDFGGELPPETGAEDDFSAIEDGAGGADGCGPGAAGDDPREGTLERMNADHCVVDDGGKFRVFTRRQDRALGRDCYARHARFDFESLWMHKKIEIPGAGGRSRVISLAEWWLAHPRRRQYEGVTCDPEGAPPRLLNLWSGWGVEPRDGEWGALRDLVGEILCDGDAVAFKYVMDWMAHMVQRPGSPAEVALCFRGGKGTGKGTLGRALVRIAGRHGLHISSPAHLVGRFNAHLRDCVLLFADEAFWAADQRSEGVLKALVTEPLVAYEPKGRDVEMGRNLVHVVMASNSDWVVPAGMDGERRFAVFEVSDKACGDRARFAKIQAQLEAGGLGAMLRDLLLRDVREFHPRDAVPKTRALVDQVIRGMDPVEEWWFGLLQEGRLPGAADWLESRQVPAQLLQEDFSRACDDAGFRGRRGLEVAMGQRLRVLAPGIERVRRAVPTGSGLKADCLGRAIHYVIPSLHRCRAEIERRSGMKIAWPVDDPAEAVAEALS